MLIQVTHQESMKELLHVIENKQSNSIVTTLQCCFSQISDFEPLQDDLVLALKDIIGEYNSHIYMCHDNDVFILWHGGSAKTINAIKKAIVSSYPTIFEDMPEDIFFRYFDIRAHGEELRIACRKKREAEKNAPKRKKNAATDKICALEQKDADDLKALEKYNKKKSEFVVKILDKKYVQVDDDFFKMYKAGLPLRDKRIKPKFLIIEDQSFAGRMLARVISDFGDPIIAPNGTEGLFMYAMYVPDIVFIDVNLPDSTGHQLAEFIRDLDSDAHIVMVTANHSENDVAAAVKNKVQGFMIKPYTLNKVKEVLKKYKMGKSK